MLYDEFLNGTGCRDNAENFKVYKNLEIMYMNSDMTKDEIYEYGKKLVTNELSAETKNLIHKINEEIENCKNEIEFLHEKINVNEQYFNSGLITKNEFTNNCKLYRHEIKKERIKMKELKYILSI